MSDKNENYAKNKGFGSHYEYMKNFALSKGFSSYNEYQISQIKKKGYNSIQEYRNAQARKKGFKNYKEYRDNTVRVNKKSEVRIDKEPPALTLDSIREKYSKQLLEAKKALIA